MRQPHNLFSRTRDVLDAELPGMIDRLVDAGCTWVEPARRPSADDDRHVSSSG